jgi:hypothetical protein
MDFPEDALTGDFLRRFAANATLLVLIHSRPGQFHFVPLDASVVTVHLAEGRAVIKATFR